MDPDQTPLIGAVWSGFMLIVSLKKSSMKCTWIYTAVNIFSTNNSGGIRVNPVNCCSHLSLQSELPRTTPWNSVESHLGCTLRIYVDNVTLTLHNLTLTSQKPCQHIYKCDCSKTNGYKWSLCFFNKISLQRYFFLKTIDFIYSVDKRFWVIKILDFNRTGLNSWTTELFFLTPVPANKMELFHTKYYTLHTSEAWFSNWADVFQLLSLM